MSNGKQIPKCFVISNNTGVDVSPASKFGDIRHLFEDLKDSDIMSDDFELDCIRALHHWGFDFGEDFIVIAGNITAVCRLVAALMSEYETIGTLVWSKESYNYRILEIGVNKPIEETTNDGDNNTSDDLPVSDNVRVFRNSC